MAGEYTAQGIAVKPLSFIPGAATEQIRPGEVFTCSDEPTMLRLRKDRLARKLTEADKKRIAQESALQQQKEVEEAALAVDVENIAKRKTIKALELQVDQITKQIEGIRATLPEPEVEPEAKVEGEPEAKVEAKKPQNNKAKK